MDITKQVCLPSYSYKQLCGTRALTSHHNLKTTPTKCMADGSPRRLCVSLTHSMGPIFTKWTDYFKSSSEKIWKSIWNKHKIIVWICWPYIYVEWWSKCNILWCNKPAWELQKQCPPTVLTGKASTWFSCLPACEESLLTRKEYTICRSPPQIEAYSLGIRPVRRDLNVISHRNKTENSFAASFKNVDPVHSYPEMQATGENGESGKKAPGGKHLNEITRGGGRECVLEMSQIKIILIVSYFIRLTCQFSFILVKVSRPF